MAGSLTADASDETIGLVAGSSCVTALSALRTVRVVVFRDPFQPLSNSVTPWPKERITPGRRLPKNKNAINATIAHSMGLLRKANKAIIGPRSNAGNWMPKSSLGELQNAAGDIGEESRG